jgi:hypothetical protein
MAHWRTRHGPHRGRHRQRSKNGGQSSARWRDRLWPPLFKQRSDICRSAALGCLPNFGCVLPDWFSLHGWDLLQGAQMIAGFRFRTFSSEARSDVVVRESRFVPMPRLVEALFRLAPPAN